MNPWLALSIEYANQKSYLDDLFLVYPTIPDGIRRLDTKLWATVEEAFAKGDNHTLLHSLLALELFPIKDSYVAYLKRDPGAVDRNPTTVARLAGRLYEMGLDTIQRRCAEPKETNRQMGQAFPRWLARKALGIAPVPLEQFIANDDNAVLSGGDAAMMAFAREHLNYTHTKGLDLVARFNGKYVIGEAKFLTDFGGHQNAQFNDAIATLHTKGVKATTVAILDGVLYINSNNAMRRSLDTTLKGDNIMSALVLREFLYQL